MKKLKITVLYDAAEDDEREAQAEKKVSLVSEDVATVLSEQGHEVRRLAADRQVRTLSSQIDKDDSDLIFNLCESLGGVSHFEQTVAALLEVLGKRFTGAGSIGLSLAQDKELSKKVFHFHGIPYPKFSSIDAGKVEWSDDLSFPLFVKPLNQDASIGIDSGSIVSSVKELMERISYIHTEVKSAALIEEYIEGRELYVGVLGTDKPEALPILEWDFSKIPEDLPKIASTEAKWDEASPYQQAPEIFPADIPEPVYRRIQETAVQAFQALKLRDYGRVDMRLRKVSSDKKPKKRSKAVLAAEAKVKGRAKSDGRKESMDDENWEFYIIEVNPNPYLDKKDELAVAAKKHGLNYNDLIEKIVELAMERQI